jgi:N6-adenosine-specific RNA methylase IME4
MKYKTILADPPWTFKTYSDTGLGRSAEAHYDCLSLDEIKALPVGDFADDNCVLFIWITDPLLDRGFEVIQSWGFAYKTVGFYWVKTSVELSSKEEKYPIGCGYWSRANPEQCLLATRGKPHPKAHDVRRLLIAPRREHSRKPDEAYDRIERLCEGPYLELFARHPRAAWDTAFSTLEGTVERRWKSNQGKSSTILPTTPEELDIFAYGDC